MAVTVYKWEICTEIWKIKQRSEGLLIERHISSLTPKRTCKHKESILMGTTIRYILLRLGLAALVLYVVV